MLGNKCVEWNVHTLRKESLGMGSWFFCAVSDAAVVFPLSEAHHWSLSETAMRSLLSQGLGLSDS